MENETIRVGMIGAGTNTIEKHIPGFRSLSGVDIVSVCNRSRESSEKVAQEFEIPKVYTNWRQVVEDPDTDAVLIGTWPYLHERATIAALEAGKHVLCEARMAMNAEQAHMMLETAHMYPDLVAQVVPSPFTLRMDTAIKRIIAEGHLGDPLVIEVRDGGQFLDPKSPLHWRQDFDLSGYNTLSLGIWYECIMRWLGEATTVMAMGKTFIKMRRDQDKLLRPVRVPEHIDVIADMACGAQAHFQISAVTGLAGKSEAYLFGDNGTLKISNDKLYGAQGGSDTLKEIPVPKELEGKWRVEEEFIHAIRGTEKIKLTTFDDGVKYMEFTEAVAISMATGQKVSLPL